MHLAGMRQSQHTHDVQVEIWTFDNRAVTQVDLLVDGQPAGSAVPVPFMPMTVTWSTANLAEGAHTLTAVATDSAGLQTASSSVMVVATNGSNAVYGASGFAALGCLAPQPICDSGALLDGRGPLGPEPNAPNKLAGSPCADAVYGSYHGHAEVDAIRVAKGVA
jgi:hypothetical protein